jgi:hypothetical protein
MGQLAKLGIVLAGYAAALLAACGAVGVRVANTSGPDAQASAGMYAFGDGLLFLAVFGFAALLPTGMSLFFLRPYRLFWVALSAAAVAVALTGLAAVLIYVLASWGSLQGLTWESLAALAVLRMLASPLLAACFIVSILIAPTPSSRWALLAATGIESMAAAYASFHWFASYCTI